MSALDNMLADILKKALPPEIMEMLTPEKIAEFGDKINAYIVDTRERLTRIEEMQQALLERLDDDGYYNSAIRNGNASGIGDSSGSGSGSIGTSD